MWQGWNMSAPVAEPISRTPRPYDGCNNSIYSCPTEWVPWNAAAAAAKSLQSCPTLCDPIHCSPPGSPRPWDSPGKNTGVGCHFLLQCMKVKSESEVAQSCPTLSDPMDWSLSGSSVHGIFQARELEWGAIAFSDLGMVGQKNICHLVTDSLPHL